jgi:hypothetical protein
MKRNFNKLNPNDMKIVNAGYRHQGTHIGPSGPACFRPLNEVRGRIKELIDAVRSRNM